eukprot:754334-Hanusia_phi.AAC.5
MRARVRRSGEEFKSIRIDQEKPMEKGAWKGRGVKKMSVMRRGGVENKGKAGICQPVHLSRT